MPRLPSGLAFETIVVPTPYAVGPANVHLFPGPPVTLFDCGPNTAETEAALEAGLRRHGFAPERIERIVISHGHPDHYGMAPSLRERSGARVFVGERDLPKLAGASMLQATGRLLLQAGMPLDRLRDMGDRERTLGSLRPIVEGAEPLAGGEVLAFERFQLQVLHLPGHTAGHVCLYDQASGTLFSGDTLLLEISPNPIMEPDPADPSERRRSLVEYLGSLDRLARMRLARAYPGHGPVIEDPHALIERMRAHHHRRAEELSGLLDGAGRTAWDLANQLFPRIEGFDNFLAVSEVVAHLDLLVDAGTAEALEDRGVTRYRRRAVRNPGSARP